MFIGHPEFFAHPNLPGIGSSWSAIEVTPLTPWFIALVFDDADGIYAQFAISGANVFEVLQENRLPGKLADLFMVTTMRTQDDVGVTVTKISDVYKNGDFEENDPDRFVVQSADGRYWGGYPLRPLVLDAVKLKRVNWWVSSRR